MELINFIGAQASKDGKWLLVTFGRKDTDEKVRWLVPFKSKRFPVAEITEDNEGKPHAILILSLKKKEEEEPKQEAPDAIAEEELPF